MKLSVLRKLMANVPPDFDYKDQTQRSKYVQQMGLDPGAIYQELEMESDYVDTHRDVSFAGSPVNLHSHDFYELLYCCNTCGAEYLVGTERYRLQKGDVILIPPGLSHRPLLPDSMAEPYIRIVLWISREFMANILRSFPEVLMSKTSYSVLLRTAGTPWESLEELFLKGAKIAQESSDESRLLLIGNTITLLAHLRQAFLDRAAGRIKAEKPELLDRIMTYIEQNLSRHITLTDTAKAFYVSESTVSHIFRNKLGVSFYRFVTQRRLIAAKVLIQEGSILEQVAEQVGFSDYSSFYRAFKQEYGISPRQFRKL